jgi:tetratricopeptide (TPR) repeat protein
MKTAAALAAKGPAMHTLPKIAAGLTLTLALSAAWPAGGGGGGGAGGGAVGGVDERLASDPDYVAAMAAVKKEDWNQVILRMKPVVQRIPDQADAWNELGHAYRKTGDMDNSFSHYAKALEIDPKHRGAHEYLGEAYLQIGDLARAEQELRTLDKLCFLPCEEYTDLKEQVRRYKATHPATATR